MTDRLQKQEEIWFRERAAMMARQRELYALRRGNK